MTQPQPTWPDPLPPDRVFARLQAEVIAPGLCTHCGTCAGLSEGELAMRQTPRGPLPSPTHSGRVHLPPAAYAACAGRGLNYPDLCRTLFGHLPSTWLAGCYRRFFIGHAADEEVRRAAASGGVITRTLLYLLEQGMIEGAVVVRQGHPEPWLAEPTIARTAEEIRAASQSVYLPVPVNTLLSDMAAFDGRLAYVGLPDQVASLRWLQQLGHPGAQKVAYVLGPYVGTNTYLGAIESFLRSHGVEQLNEVARLRYREGEWPGCLQITTRSGRVLRARKFYYNYLTPFYLTRSTLFAVDFTNELTDLSVGDAWSPRYEQQGGGFSVVVARSQRGDELVQAMRAAGVLCLEETTPREALAMHAHMLDFKKRGAFIRMGWRQACGHPTPDYGYHPVAIPAARVATEVVISAIFAVCRTHATRRLVELVPLAILGPLFDTLRKSWKRVSKPVKRRGLWETRFETREEGEAAAGKHRVVPETAWSRTVAEVCHWLRPDWSFAAVGAHWDCTEDYDDINEKTYSYMRRFVDGFRLSAEAIPDGARVLDFCARTGNGTLYYYERGKVGHAVCADVSHKMGAICRARLADAGFTSHDWVPIYDYSLPFGDGAFDAVLCFETVEHVADPARLIAELGRVTRPGGTLVLTTPNLLWEPIHALAAITALHHSEGPHRFIRYAHLLRMVAAAGFCIDHAETTVLVPGGPRPLVRAGEWLEQHTRRSLMPLLGLRRVIVGTKH